MIYCPAKAGLFFAKENPALCKRRAGDRVSVFRSVYVFLYIYLYVRIVDLIQNFAGGKIVK